MSNPIKAAIAETINLECKIDYNIAKNSEHIHISNANAVADSIVYRLSEIGYSIVNTKEFESTKKQLTDAGWAEDYRRGMSW